MVMTQLIAWSSATIFFQAVKSRGARANTKLKLVPPNWICDFYRICGICQDSTEQSKVLKLWNEELLYCAVKTYNHAIATTTPANLPILMMLEILKTVKCVILDLKFSNLFQTNPKQTGNFFNFTNFSFARVVQYNALNAVKMGDTDSCVQSVFRNFFWAEKWVTTNQVDFASTESASQRVRRLFLLILWNHRAHVYANNQSKQREYVTW